MVYIGYYKVMSNIPKMGHLPTPEVPIIEFKVENIGIIDLLPAKEFQHWGF